MAYCFQGIQGQVLSVPAFTQRTGSSSEAFDPSIVVRWSIGLPSGLYFLLSCISSTISYLHKVSAQFSQSLALFQT